VLVVTQVALEGLGEVGGHVGSQLFKFSATREERGEVGANGGSLAL
jgi:hypothetical protein